MALEESGGRGRESERVVEGEVTRLPAAAAADTATVLERGEELVTAEGIVGCAESVPLGGGDAVDALEQFSLDPPHEPLVSPSVVWPRIERLEVAIGIERRHTTSA